MNVLLTGATGYIGQRLLPALLENGHQVICCVRDTNRMPVPEQTKNLRIVELDFLQPKSLNRIPLEIDAAYYLLHSMSVPGGHFERLEQEAALNFKARLQNTTVRHVIYLSGIVNEQHLSKHLRSRKRVEEILSTASFPLTTLRAGIIVGAGSASFEIIRDLVEKLPVMIAPRWLNTKSQPIAITNVIDCLTGVLGKTESFRRSYDIGGPDILTYKQMLQLFSNVRRLRRTIKTVPVMTPKLSSYWLYFITSTSYHLAKNLVDSMKVDVVCRNNDLVKELGIDLIDYKTAVRRTFDDRGQYPVLSGRGLLNGAVCQNPRDNIQAPRYGCFRDCRQLNIEHSDRVLEKIWSIGGENGWYYADWLWGLRGFIDSVLGGVGMRRTRKSQNELVKDDVLDFWRVWVADKTHKRLLLFAEMKLPGEAWLEFKIVNDERLVQTATFRPRGLWGRIYWYAVLPFHYFIFKGLLKKLVKA